MLVNNPNLFAQAIAEAVVKFTEGRCITTYQPTGGFKSGDIVYLKTLGQTEGPRWLEGHSGERDGQAGAQHGGRLSRHPLAAGRPGQGGVRAEVAGTGRRSALVGGEHRQRDGRAGSEYGWWLQRHALAAGGPGRGDIRAEVPGRDRRTTLAGRAYRQRDGGAGAQHGGRLHRHALADYDRPVDDKFGRDSRIMRGESLQPTGRGRRLVRERLGIISYLGGRFG